MMGDHKALKWVEAHFPNVRGAYKGMLILAYGAGLDEGLREAQEAAELIIGQLLLGKDGVNHASG